MIKIFPTLAFALLFFTIGFADQAPDVKTRYQIIDDSVHFTDGRVISFEEFEKENSEANEGKIARKTSGTESEEEKSIIPSWKFYTLMLAFPVFLILIFVMVFIRGRK